MTAVGTLVAPAELRAALPSDAQRALEEMTAAVTADPSVLGRLFPAAARRTARGELAPTGHRTEDAVRVELVAAAATRLAPADLLAELQAIYRYGDGDEKRGVLLAIGVVEDPGLDGSEVLLDALRTNDVRLVAAAMGPHAARLSAHDWRHGVLKCLFVGVPLTAVADLDTRVDAELGAIVRRYVDEREAAGRPVPADALALIDLTTTTGPEA
ncbi:EboA domain-containing protein [Nocardioides plantarum]|uniref:EboA domain-containing protein n=1 Tax=Nocardioides plantarum TaxID=29299 RepID=A0ABV5KG60_9ACTN|nr:EboA domain-containing protein [Nocardioides plantarum]